MAENTEISWSDHTWSPWYGCTQVSMGEKGACVGCYARQISETRMGRVVFGGPGRGEGTRDARADSAWSEPLRWNRTTPGAFVFPSMCDPFDNHPDLPPLFRRFMRLIYDTPHLTWLLLTKRPGNIVKLFHDFTTNEIDGVVCRPPLADLIALWPRNAAIGCTVVTQEEADRDIPKLLAAKAALNPAFAFVSMEPLLGPVDLRNFLWIGEEGGIDFSHTPRHLVDWVITGGETDQGSHKGRPSHPDWFRSLRDQCAAAGVAYHHKQNGEFREFPSDSGFTEEVDADGDEADAILNAAVNPSWIAGDGRHFHAVLDLPDDLPCRLIERVGKKAAGRLLDGQVHDARPEVRR